MDSLTIQALKDLRQHGRKHQATFENYLIIAQSFYDLLQSEGYDMAHYRVNKPLIQSNS
jgi:hypothetical protein